MPHRLTPASRRKCRVRNSAGDVWNVKPSLPDGGDLAIEDLDDCWTPFAADRDRFREEGAPRLVLMLPWWSGWRSSESERCTPVVARIRAEGALRR